VGAAHAGKLIDLARSREPGDRERLLLSIADLCDSSPDSGRPEIRELLDDVFMALVVEAERDIRRALAEKLARADWAPLALINVLALDDIEIARPVILSSPLLQDKDLIRLLVEATIEHQIEVARRPRLGSEVVDAILDGGEPAVMTALANNTTAQVSEEALRRLVDASRRVASLRSPLVRHPKLSKVLAEQLYSWVGEALKAAIFDRFGVDGPALDEAMAQSVALAQQGRSPVRPFIVERDGEREEMESRLIGKLKSANQLRPGYLLRALKEGKFSLFQGALATLGDFDPIQIRRACSAPDAEPLALACAAVGIDRSVFPSLLLMVRELNHGKPGGDGDAGKRASAAFAREPAGAAQAFRRRVGGV
jgi:uncharacterized protein (DUF2336 family)